MTGRRGRGRKRGPAPLHLFATRELTAAMRQLRVAAGDDTASSLTLLNRAILELYPEAGAPPSARSLPRAVDLKYVLGIERGTNARIDVPGWIDAGALADRRTANASRVPGWLVRAYDLAFGADGYLVDMYGWATAFVAEQAVDPPRSTARLPLDLEPGTAYSVLAQGFDDRQPDIRACLIAQAEALARPIPAAEESWRPSEDDGSGSYGDGDEDVPEGTLVEPGGQLVARWVLHNTGSLPWRHRFLFRVGAHGAGVHTPPFIAVPDTDPGGSAAISCPLRAPGRSGTYRMSLKMGWPDGTYCFPTTLLGLIITLIVPPTDLADCGPEWGRE